MRPQDQAAPDEASREAHATLTRILGAIEEYVYTGEFLDDRGGYRVVFAGPCREQFLGLSVEAAQTAVWRYYVHPDDVEAFDTGHEAAARTGRLDVEYRMVGADGIVRWVRDRGRMRTEDGRRFLDGSVLDVTVVRTVQQELEAARQEADRLAHVDPLTGAENRRSLPRLLARAREKGRVGVLAIDLDAFKQVNDLFGHAAGDAVLVDVAERLRASLRTTDAVVRMGGEEFLAVLPDVRDEAALLEVAEAVRARVAATPLDAGDERLPVTVSVGAALASDDRLDLDDLLAQADRALYDAKHGGRDRVRLASAPAWTAAGRSDDTATGHAAGVARAIATSIAALDGVSDDHLEQVSSLALAVARELGLTGPALLRCRLAGLVHDAGKLRVPTEILAKPGPLDPAEWAVMRSHAEQGEKIVASVPELRTLAAIVRHHHERFDGRGYPDALAGEEIPIESRILAAVNTWSAMTSERPHCAALSPSAARAELTRASGTQLDPAVVAALESVLGAIGQPRLARVA